MQCFNPFPVLETERTILRQLSVKDAAPVFELRSNEAANRYINRPLAETIDDALVFINRIHEQVNNKRSFLWAIELKQTGEFAGTILLWNLCHQQNKVELGYELLAHHQRKGIMQEVLKKVLWFAFVELKAGIVEGWVHPNNQASIQLLNKFSFQRDEVAEQHKPATSNENIYRLKAKDHLYI